MRTFAIIAETKGNPAVSKKKPSEDDTTLEQPVNGETVDPETELDPLAEDEPAEDDETVDLDAATDGGDPAEGELPAEGEVPGEEDSDLPLDEMAAEEAELTGEEEMLDPEAELDPTAVAQQEWAGDMVVDAAEITDPAESFRSFMGQAGESAWLDRADDGTLTGWIQTADGTTYRYSDADAWAIDVDDAQMTADTGMDEEMNLEGEDPMAEEGLEEDPMAEEPLPGEEPAEEEPVEDEAPAEESGPPIDPADPSAAPEAPEDEDEPKKTPPFQGKSLVGIRQLA